MDRWNEATADRGLSDSPRPTRLTTPTTPTPTTTTSAFMPGAVSSIGGFSPNVRTLHNTKASPTSSNASQTNDGSLHPRGLIIKASGAESGVKLLALTFHILAEMHHPLTRKNRPSSHVTAIHKPPFGARQDSDNARRANWLYRDAGRGRASNQKPASISPRSGLPAKRDGSSAGSSPLLLLWVRSVVQVPMNAGDRQ